MSGLFDRLAARATGADDIVRPRLSGLFEPLPVGDGEPVDDVDEAVTAAPVLSEPGFREVLVEMAPVDREPPPAVPPTIGHAVPAPVAESDAQEPGTMAASPPGHAVEPAASLPEPPSPGSTQDGDQASAPEPIRPRHPEPDPPASVRPLDPRARPDLPQPSEALDVLSGWPVALGLEPSATGAAIPDELNEPVSETGPTIAITIGRVEVRTTPRPTATPAPARRRVPALRVPLADYLREVRR